MEIIERPDPLARIEQRFRANPAVLLIGPRQCGKTTLARQFAAARGAEYFDLESPRDASRLAEPMTALEPLRGWVVIDEAQLQPELFSLLRVLLDRRPLPARYLLLGSASPDLVRGVSETLAGRVALVPMSGFDLSEVGDGDLRTLWWRRVGDAAVASVVRESGQAASEVAQSLPAGHRPAALAAGYQFVRRPGRPPQARRFVGGICVGGGFCA